MKPMHVLRQSLSQTPRSNKLVNTYYMFSHPSCAVFYSTFVNSGFQMYSQVINYIKQRIEISREEIEEALKYSDFKKYKKGDYILRSGEHCRFIGFLNKGFIVTTFEDETGLEKASEFKHEGRFFTYTEGLTNNNPSHKNVIAIEDYLD